MSRLVTALVLLLTIFAFEGSVRARQTEPEQGLFLAFAHKLDLEMNNRSWALFDERFDSSAMIAIATKGIKVDAPFHEEFAAEVRAGLNVGEQIAQTLNNYDGSYEFMRMLPSSPPRALFRMISDAGLNYHELYLGKDAQGRISINDIYMYVSGERLSSQARRNYILGALTDHRSMFDQLLDNETAYVGSIPQIEEASKIARTDPMRSLQIVDALPPEVQELTEILMIRVRAATNLSKDAYATEMANFVESHPNGTVLDLMIIDHHLMNGQFEAALKCIERIDIRVNDPYLDILRGNVLLMNGKPEQALELLSGVVERDPRLDYETLWAIQNLALKTQDHELTLDTLLQLTNEFSVNFGNLEGHNVFSEFVASTHYETWLKRIEPVRASQ